MKGVRVRLLAILAVGLFLFLTQPVPAAAAGDFSINAGWNYPHDVLIRASGSPILCTLWVTIGGGGWEQTTPNDPPTFVHYINFANYDRVRFWLPNSEIHAPGWSDDGEIYIFDYPNTDQYTQYDHVWYGGDYWWGSVGGDTWFNVPHPAAIGWTFKFHVDLLGHDWGATTCQTIADFKIVNSG